MREGLRYLSATLAAVLLFAAAAVHATDPHASGTGTRVEVETQGSPPSPAEAPAPAEAQAPPPGHATGAGTRVETHVETQQGAPAAGQGAPAVATDVEVRTLSTEPITGSLTVKDPEMRTFVIEGEETVYVAPEDVQVQEYDGRSVTVTFDPNGRVTTIELDREG